MPFNRHEYPVLQAAAVDGDTVAAHLDLGFRISFSVLVRLPGIDAPERNRRKQQAAGEHAFEGVAWWLDEHRCPDLRCVSLAMDKYANRIVGDLFLPEAPEATLSAWLQTKGLVREYKGDKRLPWTEAELRRVLAVRILGTQL